ncbi:hypothetical protein QQZ08_011051 [Neonectria magnoliae]|uniref:Extracellular membrane protein CFEM domain-containing protein n=1 Tax=Neonectria magnoliae TaxID=2732573 RepID=A0ABR1HDF7_9HYPO
MRFTVALVAGFAAMASAATTTASVDPATASYVACLDACDAGDVKCQSYCITVPSPNESQVNATNDCVAGCEQGNGSQKQTDAYAKCVQDCISDNYYKTSSGTPRETGSSGSGSSNDKSDDDSSSNAKATGTESADSSDNTASASASASDSDSTDASETESGSDASGTATDAAASATSSDSAAAGLALGSATLIGLFAAVLAL